MQTFYSDTYRVAKLWLLNGRTMDIPEDLWPFDSLHDDAKADDKAADKWVELTNLSVTITTRTETTLKVPI